ncbi:hypothetical protein ACWOFR_03590 [Carnobacterium gallinarum]|uniref:hypothetical protein n=1 Tax=Carnobacterium gallinarum TaxID=2749 RepID=UPI0005511B3A|nr:hypothetical protein [Carnobacterium gallinarum]
MKKKIFLVLLSTIILTSSYWYIQAKNKEQFFFESHKNNENIITQSVYFFMNYGDTSTDILDEMNITYKKNVWDGDIEVLHLTNEEYNYTFYISSLRNKPRLSLEIQVASSQKSVTVWIENNGQIEHVYSDKNPTDEEIEKYQEILMQEYTKLLDSVYDRR